MHRIALRLYNGIFYRDSATRNPAAQVICNSNNPEAIPLVLQGEKLGTRFHPLPNALRGRKRWLLMVRIV